MQGSIRERADITQLLMTWTTGDRAAVDAVVPLLYDELHAIAASHVARERDHQTLAPTALVNEAYLKLVQQRGTQFQNRAHFLALSSLLMRRILVEHARARQRKKREAPLFLCADRLVEVALVQHGREGSSNIIDLLDFDRVLQRLAELDGRQARIAELRLFGGMMMKDIAAALGIALRTAEGDWYMARAWLRREMEGLAP